MDSSHSRCGRFTGKSFTPLIHFSSFTTDKRFCCGFQFSQLVGIHILRSLSLSLCPGASRRCATKPKWACGQFAMCLKKFVGFLAIFATIFFFTFFYIRRFFFISCSSCLKYIKSDYRVSKQWQKSKETLQRAFECLPFEGKTKKKFARTRTNDLNCLEGDCSVVQNLSVLISWILSFFLCVATFSFEIFLLQKFAAEIFSSSSFFSF